MFIVCGLILAVLANFSEVYADEDLIVHLPTGKIRGHVLRSENGKPYYAFQEIPYAEPPIGTRRFQIPTEPQPWTGVRDATKNTVVCYQETVNYENLNKSEDCLYLNVYTPAIPGSDEIFPVVVWIHGGRFTKLAGTFEYLGPKYIMEHGIVVVTLNYRLGPFGFLTTDDDVIPANLGLKDQLFALEWVHDNIELFGGNKSHVTIAGQSAGSYSVGLQILGPWQNGKVLYHANIQQSGTQTGTTLFAPRSNHAREAAFRIGRILDGNLSSNDSNDLLKVLQKASAEEILGTNYSGAHWPIMEKDGPFSFQAYDAIEKGNIKKIPLLVGFTSEELLLNLNLTSLYELAAFLDADPANLIGEQFNISYSDKSTAGKLLTKIYTNSTFQENIGACLRFKSDNSINPMIKEAVLMSNFTDVYLYQFAYKGDLGMQMSVPYIEGAERVVHSEELKYQWDDRSNSDLTQFPIEDRLMLHRFIKMWTNFVKYYNPTPNDDPLLENVRWQKVDPKEPHNVLYLNLNETLEMRTNPRYYPRVIKVLDSFITPDDII